MTTIPARCSGRCCICWNQHTACALQSRPVCQVRPTQPPMRMRRRHMSKPKLQTVPPVKTYVTFENAFGPDDLFNVRSGVPLDKAAERLTCILQAIERMALSVAMTEKEAELTA